MNIGDPQSLLRLLVVLASLSCAPPSPGPEIQALLDEFAPGLTIGAPLSADSQRRYRLIAAPSIGYTDPFYVSSQGLGDLQIFLDVAPTGGARQTGPLPRVESVTLHAFHEATLNPLVEKFRKVLGEPETECYSYNNKWRWRRHFWPGERGRGLLVIYSRGAVDASASPNTGSAFGSSPSAIGSVSFGARAGRQIGVEIEPCS